MFGSAFEKMKFVWTKSTLFMIVKWVRMETKIPHFILVWLIWIGWLYGYMTMHENTYVAFVAIEVYICCLMIIWLSNDNIA